MNAHYYGIAFSCRRWMLPAWTVRFSPPLPPYFCIPRAGLHFRHPSLHISAYQEPVCISKGHPERARLLPLPKLTVTRLSLDEVAEALAGTSGGATPDPRQWEAVHAMVRQGVPNHMRAKLWPVRCSLMIHPGGTAALRLSKSRWPNSREQRRLGDKTRNTTARLRPTRVCISLTRTRVARQIFLRVQQRRECGQYEKLQASSCGAVETDEPDDAPQSPGMPSSRERKLQHFKHTVSQIEKDLPRTFPNHPALNSDGREALGCVPSPCA
jgi:hypothetical protein